MSSDPFEAASGAPLAPSVDVPEPVRPTDDESLLDPAGAAIIATEEDILRRVLARLTKEASLPVERLENLDAALLELRDAISEAKEEDLPSLIDQMHQVAALSRERGRGRAVPIDPKNPYFGHLRLREARSRSQRDVLIGKHTLLDDGDGVTIVDWRNAPVSRLFYRYEEGDDYDEEFDERTLEGKVLTRRSLAIAESQLRRISAPQGTYTRDGHGRWHPARDVFKPTLEGGAGAALRVPRTQLGVEPEAAGRTDKRLQEITALIDREQFDLITQPDSGIVLIQGGAGSGKTTVALHRVAYLAFQDPKRFRPAKMVIIVFNEALVEYIRHVLPSLGVEGVTVTTYRRWSRNLLAKVGLRLPEHRSTNVPDSVARFKKHPLVLGLVDEWVARQVADLRAQLDDSLRERAGGAEVLAAWDRLGTLAPVIRLERMLEWLADEGLRVASPQARAKAQSLVTAAKGEMRDVVADWLEINTSGARIREVIAAKAADQFTATDVDTIVRWCARKAELDHEDLERRDIDPERDTTLPDPEDDAILLRLLQAKFGGVFVAGSRFEYEHIVIDEAQDLCPLEVRVLLDCATAGRSITIAGDRAQKMIFDNQFTDWPELLRDAGLPHVAIKPLKITYRSTRPVMEFSHEVLGPLRDPEEQLIAREGAPVCFFSLADVGESAAFLAGALRGVMQREPQASVALITRYPQQAEVYYEALQVAEVPRLRRVRRGDFTFSPGIDVTDVRQVKGLEFDYVVVLDPTEQNYPYAVESRHLIHIAATRAAYQLWLVCSGTPSRLLPPVLVATSLLGDG